MGSSDAAPTRLTNAPETDNWPDWSHDYNQIAFERTLGTKPDIFVMATDGSGQVNLTHSAFYDTGASWAPDGGHIAFASDRAGGALQIWTMKPDGSALVKLTSTVKLNSAPDWSPDGTRIVFESYRDGQDEIYVMNANGTGQTRLTFTGGNTYPEWSPDGSKIAFHGAHGIWVMNAYGASKTQLTAYSGDYHPAWSPNGGFIVFDSARSGNQDLWIMKPDGTGITQLTTNAKMDANPSWG
jgi:Tol biopolymer transport system component